MIIQPHPSFSPYNTISHFLQYGKTENFLNLQVLVPLCITIPVSIYFSPLISSKEKPGSTFHKFVDFAYKFSQLTLLFYHVQVLPSTKHWNTIQPSTLLLYNKDPLPPVSTNMLLIST